MAEDVLNVVCGMVGINGLNQANNRLAPRLDSLVAVAQ